MGLIRQPAPPCHCQCEHHHHHQCRPPRQPRPAHRTSHSRAGQILPATSSNAHGTLVWIRRHRHPVTACPRKINNVARQASYDLMTGRCVDPPGPTSPEWTWTGGRLHNTTPRAAPSTPAARGDHAGMRAKRRGRQTEGWHLADDPSRSHRPRCVAVWMRRCVVSRTVPPRTRPFPPTSGVRQ